MLSPCGLWFLDHTEKKTSWYTRKKNVGELHFLLLSEFRVLFANAEFLGKSALLHFTFSAAAAAGCVCAGCVLCVCVQSVFALVAGRDFGAVSLLCFASTFCSLNWFSCFVFVFAFLFLVLFNNNLSWFCCLFFGFFCCYFVFVFRLLLCTL